MSVKQAYKSFDEVITNGEQPVLVDFYATWCGPCQMMAGILEQVNGQLKGQVKIVKIDTDRYPDLASQHQVYALPTLMLFKAGEVIDRIEGVLPAEQLVGRIRESI
jgi:thioredoxin